MDNYQSTINFLISCNNRNTPFVLPFIYFAYKYNTGSSFEINITDSKLDRNFIEGLKYLRKILNYPLIRINTETQSVLPQKHRFLTDTSIKSKYTYMGDVDILICENIVNFHVQKMGNQYIYDNEIRCNSNKMSGLHFVDTEKWYDSTKNIRQKFKSNTPNILDEQMLYLIAKQSNIKIRPIVRNDDEFWRNRPAHGQHISLTRRPFNPNCHMKVQMDKKYEMEFMNTINEQNFKNLMKFCPLFNLYLNKFLEFTK